MADSIFGDSPVRNSQGPIEPIPLQYLMQGLQQQESDAKTQQSKYQDEIGSVLNITPVSQGDAEVLQKAKDAMQQGLAGVDISDLHNPQNRSKIDNIISSVTNNPDVMTVAQRSATFSKMKAEKDKAESTGKEYINPGYEDAIKYQQQGLYIKNKQFTSDGFIAKDVPKFFSEIEKNVGEKTEWKTDPVTGQRYLATYKDKQDILNALHYGIQSDPTIQKQLQHQFNQNFDGVDWNNAGKEKATTDYNRAVDLVDNANARLASLTPGTPDYLAVKTELDSHKADTVKFHEMATNNAYTGAAIKSKYESDYYNDQLDKFAEASSHMKYGEQHLGEKEKLAIEHSNRMAEESIRVNAENQRNQVTTGGSEGQLINDNGVLRVATPEEVAAGKTLPSTKSSVLHVGGSPLLGDFTTDELHKSIQSGKTDYVMELLNKAKIPNPKKMGTEFNKAELLPNGDIKVWTEYPNATTKVIDKDKTILSEKEVASLVAGKSPKQQEVVKNYYKQQDNTPIPIPRTDKELREEQTYTGLDGKPWKYTKVAGKLDMVPIIKATDDPTKLTSGKAYYLNNKVYKWNGKNLIEQ